MTGARLSTPRWHLCPDGQVCLCKHGLPATVDPDDPVAKLKAKSDPPRTAKPLVGSSNLPAASIPSTS